MSRFVVQYGVGLAAVIICLSGCYTYVPAELGTVSEGEVVRVYLTREGMAELPELPGEDEPVVSGTLVRQFTDLFLLRVPIASRREGFHTAGIGLNVRIPTTEVVQVERRELDRLGTGLLLTGSAASIAVVIFLIMDDAGGAIAPPPSGPAETRVPLLSLPFR